MTKKLLGLLFVALLCTGVAGASILQENVGAGTCTGGPSVSGSVSATPVITGTITCNGFTMPTGNVLFSVDVYVTNEGAGLQQVATPDTLIFTYSTNNFSLAGITSTISGTGGFSSYVFAPAGCTGGIGQFGSLATSADCNGTDTSVVGQTVGALTFTGTGAWVTGSPGLYSNGSEDFNIAVTFTYGNPVIPEPGSMLLVGGGLIGLAFAGRRKFRA